MAEYVVATFAALQAISDANPAAIPVGSKGWAMTDDKIYEWDGDSWVLRSIAGAGVVYGLARNAVSQGAGTYNSTEIMGYRVVVAGTGDWTINGVAGGAVTIAAAGMVVGQVYPEHLDSITVGTGGTAVLYIP